MEIGNIIDFACLLSTVWNNPQQKIKNNSPTEFNISTAFKIVLHYLFKLLINFDN